MVTSASALFDSNPMSDSKHPTWLELDQQHVWHPYSSIGSGLPVFPVKSAQGVRLTLEDGRELIDGMSSWWCAIHGYNHPTLNQAISQQMNDMAHVMFGGLTHEPASTLAGKLVDITPAGLDCVFLSDSGSVSVEVAMKMAVQYWAAKAEPKKCRMLTIRGGYHGDTLDTMSVCDPVNGMHTLFDPILPKQYFAPRPECRFNEPATDEDLAEFSALLETHAQHIAAVILEPIVQGAGGMWFYSAGYLKRVRELCDQHRVLLILDEIATGFGRTGTLFAAEHADVSPDIMCVGKALTGGYLTLAATLTSRDINDTIRNAEPNVFMHGPTFMGNPLACAVANASIDLLLSSDWASNVKRLESGLKNGLSPCINFKHVTDVRVLGAIGVVELDQAVDMRTAQPAFVEAGIWVRPFGKLVYVMPPYITSNEDLSTLTSAMTRVISTLG